LLELDQEGLEQCFSFKTRKIGMNVINSPLKYEEAVALQNSFSKNLYEKTFHYLVIKLNEKIEIEKVNLEQTSKEFRRSIGLLDIFGCSNSTSPISSKKNKTSF
jgi:myosin heavy subunit